APFAQKSRLTRCTESFTSCSSFLSRHNSRIRVSQRAIPRAGKLCLDDGELPMKTAKMKTANRFLLAAGIAGVTMFGVVAAAIAEQHSPPAAHAGAPAAAPEASDVHVVALYTLTREVMAQGDKVDRTAVSVKLKEIAKGHAEETKSDPAQME